MFISNIQHDGKLWTYFLYFREEYINLLKFLIYQARIFLYF